MLAVIKPKPTLDREKMSLFDLIAFGVMAHRRFGGVYRKAYRVLVGDLTLFPKVRYNKVVERLATKIFQKKFLAGSSKSAKRQ